MRPIDARLDAAAEVSAAIRAIHARKSTIVAAEAMEVVRDAYSRGGIDISEPQAQRMVYLARHPIRFALRENLRRLRGAGGRRSR